MLNPVLIQRILKKNDLLKSGERVIVGFSAGPDSTALLSLLHECQLKLTLIPVYVDHGLRPEESPQERKRLAEIAATYNLDHHIVEVDTLGHKKETGCSPEESARILRYEALQHHSEKLCAPTIAIAHTADDQAEEILLRLFRGTGLKGLSGMAMKTGNIIRPLLTTPKSALLEYLDSAGISFCTDSSNNDLNILRNRMRLEFLPAIMDKFNPSIRSTLLRTADILREEENFLDNYTQDKLNGLIRIESAQQNPDMNLDLLSFIKEPVAIQRRLMEKILWYFSSPPTHFHIDELISLAGSGESGKQLHLSRGLRVYKQKSELVFSQPMGEVSVRGSMHSAKLEPIEIEPEKTYHLSTLKKTLTVEISKEKPDINQDNLLLDADKLLFPLILRPAKPGERFSPPGLQGSKKVSRFLSDEKIPQRNRCLHPVLISAGRVAAVVGLRVDQGFIADTATKRYALVRWQDDQG